MKEKYYLFKEEKEIGSRKKVRVRKTVYFLQEIKDGYRVEVNRILYSNVVEVSLMFGGDVSQVKQFTAVSEVLLNPTKDQLESLVKKYCANAGVLINEAINKRGSVKHKS
ncbi:hypothetical protein WKH57_24860 [Niallia taxi]|uniref:hypothetical protein n=1 Tax=Niallia taxi TaxID=2499688 RepID=UPI00203FCAAA|nr:hypothetical protein [Niallia taxi]MCM3216813.1 hypothetical protein [Niallia taxi]